MTLLSLKRVKRLFVSLTVLIGWVVVWVLEQPVALAEEIFQGHLEHYGQGTDTQPNRILDQQTQEPLNGAIIQIPDAHFKTQANSSGQFQLPSQMAKPAKPTIMTIQKPGYVPFSVTLSQNTQLPLRVYLTKQAQSITLDSVLRHLGDGSFSPDSSNAYGFRKPPDGPAIRIQFQLNRSALPSQPYLQIGSIVGLDTKMAHYLSGNAIEATAGPLLVKLNQHIIARIQVNGDQQKVQIPAQILNLNGVNVLEIEAGYQITDDQRLDYDDMELVNLVLYL